MSLHLVEAPGWSWPSTYNKPAHRAAGQSIITPGGRPSPAVFCLQVDRAPGPVSLCHPAPCSTSAVQRAPAAVSPHIAVKLEAWRLRQVSDVSCQEISMRAWTPGTQASGLSLRCFRCNSIWAVKGVDSRAEHGPRHASICVDRPDSYQTFWREKGGGNKEESLLHTTYRGPHTLGRYAHRRIETLNPLCITASRSKRPPFKGRAPMPTLRNGTMGWGGGPESEISGDHDCILSHSQYAQKRPEENVPRACAPEVVGAGGQSVRCGSGRFAG